MALEGVQLIEFSSSPKSGDGILTSMAESYGETEINSNNDPLVSGPITPVTFPIELVVQPLGLKTSLLALLNSGCTRCLVNSILVEKLGIRTKGSDSGAFYQLDSSIVGVGDPNDICD